MNTKQHIAFVVAVVVLGAGAYFSELQFLSYSSSPASTFASSTAARGDTLQRQGVTSAASDATSAKSADVDFTLRAGGKNYSGAVKPGATVLDAMSALASVGDFQFTSKNFSGMGAFVESVNSKQAVDGYYWILYINGKSSDVGASQATLHSGDTVEWKYERSDY